MPVVRRTVKHNVAPATGSVQRREGPAYDEARETAVNLMSANDATRPANTNKSYQGVHEMYRKFCLLKGYECGDLVTGEKVTHYLFDCLLRRKGSKGAKQRPDFWDQDGPLSDANPNGLLDEGQEEVPDLTTECGLTAAQVDWVDRVPMTFAASLEPSRRPGANAVMNRILTTEVRPRTLRLHVAALMDLWKHQRQLHGSNEASPREWPAPAMLIKIMEKTKIYRNAAMYRDKGRHTFFDGFQTEEQLVNYFKHFMTRNKPEALRDGTAACLGLYALFRSENQRMTQLSNLGMRELQTSGPSRLITVVVSQKGTKTQKDSMSWGEFTRHKCLERCPVSFMAMYLVYRFDLSGDHYPESNTSFPDLSDPSKWYDYHLFIQTDQVDKPMTYQAQLNSVGHALGETKIPTTEKTHLMRKTGARLLEMAGCHQDDISRHGGWATAVVATTYLPSTSTQCIRAAAGFPPADNGYYLPRDVALEGEFATLLQLIFPKAAAAEELFRDRKSQLKDTQANTFLHLLGFLRRVFLQDAPHLRKLYPDYFLWQHPIFSRPLYLQWEQHALAQTALRQVDFSQELVRVLPRMVETLRQEFGENRAAAVANTELLKRIGVLAEHTRSQTKQLAAEHSAFASHLVRALRANQATGPVTVHIPSLSIPGPLANSSFDGVDTSAGGGASRGPPAAAAQFCGTVPVPETPAATVPCTDSGAERTTDEESALAHRGFCGTDPVPQNSASSNGTLPFALCRSPFSITIVWREYTEGLAGKPSSQFMYDTPGKTPVWDDTEARYWRDRVKIINFIKRLAQESRSTGGDERHLHWHAVKQLEDYCQTARLRSQKQVVKAIRLTLERHHSCKAFLRRGVLAL